MRFDGHSGIGEPLGVYRLGRRIGAAGRLTLIGRMRGQRFQCLSGQERLVFDADPSSEEEDRKHRRKSAQ